MAGKLRELMLRPTGERTTDDYEKVFDDYVAADGGRRVVDAVAVPAGVKNADYLTHGCEWQCILELKQIRKYDRSSSPESYLADLHAQGRLKAFEVTGPNTIRTTPGSLSRDEWRAFYDRFGGGIAEALKTANRQIRSTAPLLPSSAGRVIGGVYLVNTGNFQLATDFMFRLIERIMKSAWRSNQLRSIEFVSCFTVDMMAHGQHPMHARHIVRPGADGQLKDVAWGHYQRWIAYVNSELGTTTTLTRGDEKESARVNMAPAGKLQLIPDVKATEA